MTTAGTHRWEKTEGSGGNIFYRGNSADGQNRPRHPPNPDQARREAAVKDDSSNDEMRGDGWMNGLATTWGSSFLSSSSL